MRFLKRKRLPVRESGYKLTTDRIAEAERHGQKEGVKRRCL
jgi:hypothetical protein